MTPDLMESMREVRERHEARTQQAGASGGDASFGRLLQAGQPDFTQGVALYLDDITVSFDGFRALNKLSLAINVGELRCIIGPNGAGKTTMMDVITGKTRPTDGQAFFAGKHDLTKLDEASIAQLGIGRKFQTPTVFEMHTVEDNIRLALKADRRTFAANQAAH